MADIELVIKIPEEVKRAFDCAESNDLKAGYYDLGGVIGAAIKNGKPFDDVLDKIKEEIFLLSDNKCNGNSITIYSWRGMQRKVFDIIDTYKAESEG